MASTQIDFDGALAKLREFGLMLETDRAFPSLVALMAGGPVKGTWWAHPLANDIYMVGMRLMHLSEVIFLRLVLGKMTYVHRRFWPALYSVARAREPWQFADLPPTAKSMLAVVDEREIVRMDEIPSKRPLKELGADARLLESRLLVFGDNVHTDSGAHVKRITTWQRWARDAVIDTTAVPSASEGRRQLEQIVATLNTQFNADGTLPWQTPPRRKSKRKS